MAEGGQSEGFIEVTRVVLNSTIPDIDGENSSKNTDEIGNGGCHAHMIEAERLRRAYGGGPLSLRGLYWTGLCG